MLKYFFLLVSLISFTAFSQQPATNSSDVENALQQKDNLTKSSIVKNIPFTNIGPTIMSGRVADIAVNPNNPAEFYVGYASGGVWHTTNNGSSFMPILDNSPTQNVGSLAVDWKNNTIWVGTGEVNSSRSSYAGIGLLKSTDNGKTWENIGLTDSHHISKILVNPNNSNEIIVGVVGHLYSKNDERGVFKTTDGGKNWTKTLFVNNQSGIIEMEVDSNNFNLMYASSWDKDRKAWNFSGSGEGSAIYKSTDAGSTWTHVSKSGSGFPTGDGVGRIGLAIFNENTVYAIHDNQFRRDDVSEKKGDEGLVKDDFKSMTTSEFLAIDDKKLNEFLRQNRFQEKYQAQNVKQMIRSGSAKPIDIAMYLEDANSLLFDTPVVGAEVYKSTNGGKTWKKTHDGYLDDIYYSYGYYFGKIHVDPTNKNGIYIYGVPILKSKDGGKTFTSISAENVHADHHSLWINPLMPGHLINGNDGGINISYDDGETWAKMNSPSVGQFYAINIDFEKPYNVYGGLQDNGVWKGPNTNVENKRWHQTGAYNFESIMGGDGMQIQIDNRNSNVVYTGFQFGNYFRLNLDTGEQTYIQPKHELGESPFRFNWQTPILLSSHNQDILYFGGNKLMRSMNRGTDWDVISRDLTNGGKKGNVAYGTITSISESSYEFGLIYTGSDDGLVHLTRNGGNTWNNISGTFPKDLWVSRVIASQHKKSRVYVTLNGYRWDDFKAYVFVSEDFGATWKDISSNLPASPVNVIREDTENLNLLYLGTDNGAYVSFDKGDSWHPFSEGLPNVAVHDIVVHPEAKELILGTHGRSIYKTSIALLQNMDDSMIGEIVLSELKPMRYSRRWGASFSKWMDAFEPSLNISFYSPVSGKAIITISSEDGSVLNQIEATVSKGFSNVTYDLTMTEKGKKDYLKGLSKIGVLKADNGKYYLPSGKYTITFNVEGKTKSTTLEIK